MSNVDACLKPRRSDSAGVYRANREATRAALPDYDDDGVIYDPANRVQTALHEAGHAVAYLALGIKFRYITLNPRTPDCVGLVAPRPRNWVALPNLAVIALAGVASEQYLHWLFEDAEQEAFDHNWIIADQAAALGRSLGDRWEDDVEDPAALLTAVSLLSPILGGDHSEVTKAATLVVDPTWLLLHAIDIVSGHWSSVTAIALTLLNRSQALSYNQAREIAFEAWPSEAIRTPGPLSGFFLPDSVRLDPTQVLQGADTTR